MQQRYAWGVWQITRSVIIILHLLHFLHLLLILYIAKNIQVFLCFFCCCIHSPLSFPPLPPYVYQSAIPKPQYFWFPCVCSQRYASCLERGTFPSFNRTTVKWGKAANIYLWCPIILASSVQHRYCLVTAEDTDCTDTFFHGQQCELRLCFWP